MKRHSARQSANRRWTAFRTYCFTGALVVALLTLPGLAFAADLPSPHTSSSAATAACSSCHVPHQAEGPFLTRHKTSQELCFTCHGVGGAAKADIQAELTELGVKSSHPATSTTGASGVGCDKCHTPHQGPAEGNPSSIRVSSGATSGAEVCKSCHAKEAAAVSAGHAGMDVPGSPANISCLGCHEQHASTNEGLIRSKILVGETTYNVTSQADLCRTCHAEAAAGIIAGLTKHATVSEDTSVAVAGEAGSACAKCHDPHTGTVAASGDALCLACHAAEGLSYPAGYSFRGQAVYSGSSHFGLTSTNGFKTLGYDSVGFGAWESVVTTPTPGSPGFVVPSDEASKVVLMDKNILGTDAASEGETAFQLYRFNIGRLAVADISAMRVQWAGRGASGVMISVWDVANSSWAQLSANSDPDGSLLEDPINDPASFISLTGDVWVLMDATYKVGASPTLATDFIGLALSYRGAQTSGSCTVCHSMHGGSVDGIVPVGQVAANEGRLCTGEGGIGCHGVNAVGTADIASKLSSDDPHKSHDLMPEAQAATGAQIKCSDCHNPHADNATAPYADPEDISASAKTGLDAAVDAERYAYILIGAMHDGIPPLISNVALSSVGATRAVLPLLEWDTDESATSWVEWGLTEAYGASTGNDYLLTKHSVSIDATLVAGQTYHYRVRSVDALGNVSHSEDATYAAFVPPPAPLPSDAVLDRTTEQLIPMGGVAYGHAGWLSLTATSTPVVSPDGHAAEYQFELQTLHSEPRLHSISPWLTEPSWDATTGPEVYNVYAVRVRSRDSVHPSAVSEWSTYSDVFEYSNTDAYEGPVGSGVTTSGDAEASWLADHEPVQYFEPGAYSVDSDMISLCVVGSDGGVTYLTPDSGWESASSVDSTPTPPASDVLGVEPELLATATSDDSVMWRTALAQADGHYNWQIARFNLTGMPLGEIRELTFVWNGHGEPTPEYGTTVQVWNAKTSSWEVAGSGSFPTDTDVSYTVSAGDKMSMCLRCHDGLPPVGVVFPDPRAANIAPSWTGEDGDFHGANAGTGFGMTGLKPPYAVGSGALQCPVCHDSHGSDSVYHIASKVNGQDVPAITGGNYTLLCKACHQGAVRNMHEGCATRCHYDPYSHGNDAGDISFLLPDESSDCSECHGHGERWTHPLTGSQASCHGCHVEVTYPRTF